MAICKFCGNLFDWGSCNGKWVTLIPVGEDSSYEKAYQDEEGKFRAAHKNVCTKAGFGSLNVTKLARPIPANIDPDTGEITS